MEIIVLIIILFMLILYSQINSISLQLSKIERKLDLLQNGSLKPQIEKSKEETIYKKEILPTKPPPKQTKKPDFLQKLVKRFKSKSLEDFLIGNFLLNTSVVAFILGIGFFLKYSIDQNWIPVWGRVLTGVGVGFALLFGGIKTIDNKHKLFSEGLFGSAIAILYLSIYAAFALEGFIFLDFKAAFLIMVFITLFAGVIAIRYDSMTTAVFGLIGGFATPLLINNGSDDITALMIYILLLNFGILYIAFSKKWAFLNWFGFILTVFMQSTAVYKSDGIFIFLTVIFLVIFLIYSVVPFINEIKQKKLTLSTPMSLLFGTNLLVFLALLGYLFKVYDIYFRYFSIVTLLLALYLLGYAYFIIKKGIFTKNLFYILLSQALALLIITPTLLFEGDKLSAVWSIEAVVMLIVAQKSGQKIFFRFALLSFVAVFSRYLFVDVVHTYFISTPSVYLNGLLQRIITIITITGSFFTAYKLKSASLFKKEIAFSGIFLFFVFLNVEILSGANLFFPKASQSLVTLLWIVFGIAMFVISLFKEISTGKKVSMALIIIAILKAFFIDLADLDSFYRILLFLLVGILLFVFAYFYKNRADN